MRYPAVSLLLSVASCVFSLSLVPVAESSYLRRAEDGALEFEMDLLDLPRKLNELSSASSSTGSTSSAATPAAITEEDLYALIEREGVIGREYEYEEGSDPSLLNKLIQLFIPHINQAFQNAIPDPFAIPLRGSFNLPQINMFGYCTADAGFDVSLGTMTGLSGLSIQRMQVFAGTQRVSAGWNVNKGCLQTLFSAFFDVEIASTRSFSVNDMYGGIHGSVCSYSLDEYVTGGMVTVEPRMRGAINITGEIIGTSAKLNLADMRKSLKLGYNHIEAYIDDAPDALNDAMRNITAELSVLAKDRILNVIMREELVDSVTPQVTARARESIQGQTTELEIAKALELNTQFMRNQMSDEVKTTIDTAVTSALSFFQRIGFTWDTSQENTENQP